MADPLIGLESKRASVQPGGQAQIAVTITNPGTVVEGYRLQVLGPAAAWAQVVPPEVSVYPQQSASIAVVFSPPSGTTAMGGTYPFGVIAASTLDPKSSAVAEGDVDVAKVFGLQAKIVPVTSAGRWRGRHTIHLSNRGNASAHLRMSASDPDEALGFYLSPGTVSLPPGGQATVRLAARARRPFLRGSPVRLPFEVVGERMDAQPELLQGPGYGDPSRPVVAAAFNHKPILSAGFVTLVLAALAALIGLVAFLQFRPAPPEEPLAERNAPARPLLAVAATAPGMVLARWDVVDLADRYQLQQVDRAGANMIETHELRDVNTKELPVLPPATEACFRLRAFRGEVPGPWSGTECVKVEPPASASPSPSAASSATASATPSATATTASPTSTWPPRQPLPALKAVRGSVTINGDNTDWQWLQVARADHPVIGTTAATGEIYLMWDEQALYLLAQIRDASVDAPDPADLSSMYRGDAVILELGPDNRTLSAADLACPLDSYYMFGVVAPAPSRPRPGDVVASQLPTEAARQLAPTFAPPVGATATPSTPPSAIIGVLGPNARGTSFDVLKGAGQITAATSRVSGGYIIEARIPWASTGLNAVKAGDTLAANVIVTDRLADSRSNRGMVSTNAQRSVDLRAHPFYWQQLELQ